MAKYRKKPVEVEAIQWNGNNFAETSDFIGSNAIWEQNKLDKDKHYNLIPELSIYTLEGIMRANIGDYIIKGVNGEFYPCKPDIFEKTYEKVGEE